MHKTKVHCIASGFLCLPALYFDGLVLWSPELVIRTKDFAINIFLLCGFACLSLLLLLRAPLASEPNLSGTNASQGWKAVVAKASSNIAIFNAYIRASCMFLRVFFPTFGWEHFASDSSHCSFSSLGKHTAQETCFPSNGTVEWGTTEIRDRWVGE